MCRLPAWLLAAAILALTLTCIRRAWADLGVIVRGAATRILLWGEVPADGLSNPISLPEAKSPVLVMWSVESPERARATGMVAMTYHPRPTGPSIVNPGLSWMGLTGWGFDDDLPTGPVRYGALSLGNNGPGTGMVALDGGGQLVVLQNGPQLFQFRVRNGNPNLVEVTIKMIW